MVLQGWRFKFGDVFAAFFLLGCVFETLGVGHAVRREGGWKSDAASVLAFADDFSSWGLGWWLSLGNSQAEVDASETLSSLLA